jgi:hypothetical protein
MAEAAPLIQLPNKEALYPELLALFRTRAGNGELRAQYKVRERAHDRGPIWVRSTIGNLENETSSLLAAMALDQMRTGQPPNLRTLLFYQSAAYTLALLRHLASEPQRIPVAQGGYSTQLDWPSMMAAMQSQPPNDNNAFLDEIVNVVED